MTTPTDRESLFLRANCDNCRSRREVAACAVRTIMPPEGEVRIIGVEETAPGVVVATSVHGDTYQFGGLVAEKILRGS